MSARSVSSFARRYGPWAVVTGASDGLGRACAAELAAAGLNLVLVARREPELARVAADLAARFPVSCRVLVADLARPEGRARVERETAELEVGLAVLAAGFGGAGPFLAAEPAEDDAMLEVNCRAVLEQARSFGRRLVARGRGGLILFGSLVGFQGAPWSAQYAATKAYVQSLGEALHVELAPHDVDVLVAAPGPVHTGFAARARMQLGQADRPAAVARATVRALGRRMTVTPGAVGKFLTWSLMTAPRFLRVRIMGKIMGGLARRPG